MENPREWARTLAPSTEADDSKRQAVEQRAMTPCSSGEAQGRLAKMEGYCPPYVRLTQADGAHDE